MIRGQTIVIDIVAPKQSIVICREEVLGRLLMNLIEQCNMTYMGLTAHSSASGKFPSLVNPTQQGGVTTCTVMAKVLGESHIDILASGGHTWTEDGYLHIDIATCKPLSDEELKNVRQWLKDHFRPSHLEIQIVPWKVPSD